MTYYKYKELYIKKGDDYELERVIGGDVEISKVPGNLLSFDDLEETRTERELIVWVYVKYNHKLDDYTTLGYEICE